jgi:hypothetical protein
MALNAEVFFDDSFTSPVQLPPRDVKSLEEVPFDFTIICTYTSTKFLPGRVYTVRFVLFVLEFLRKEKEDVPMVD